MIFNTQPRAYCAALAAVVAAVICGWSWARVEYLFGGNLTSLFYHGSKFPLPPEMASGTLAQEGAGYDGQFYHMLAHDPLLQKDFARYVDYPRIRFRRILVPGLAWLLGLGDSGNIDRAYFALEMFFLALGVYWTGLLFARRGGSPMWGLLFVVLPGTLASFDRMLLDCPLTALFAGFLLYAEEERWGPAWVIAMLAALTRETGLLLIGGVVAAALLRRDWRLATWFSAAAAPAAGWFLFITLRLPPDVPVPNLSLPLLGIVQRLFWLRPCPNPAMRTLLHFTDVLAVAGLLVSLFMALQWLRGREYSAVKICVLLFVLLGMCLGSDALLDAFSFGRPVSPLLLWLMLEAYARRQWAVFAAPFCISASVSMELMGPAIWIARLMFS